MIVQRPQASVHYSFHCMCNLMNRYSRELNRVITVWNYSGPVYVGEYQNSTALMTVFRMYNNLCTNNIFTPLDSSDIPHPWRLWLQSIYPIDQFRNRYLCSNSWYKRWRNSGLVLISLRHAARINIRVNMQLLRAEMAEMAQKTEVIISHILQNFCAFHLLNWPRFQSYAAHCLTKYNIRNSPLESFMWNRDVIS